MCQCTFEALPVGLLLRRTAPARDAACTADSTAPPPPPLTPPPPPPIPPLACPPWVRDRCRGSGVYPPRHASPPPLPPAPSPIPPSPLAAIAAPGTKFEARNAPSTHVGGVSRYLRSEHHTERSTHSVFTLQGSERFMCLANLKHRLKHKH